MNEFPGYREAMEEIESIVNEIENEAVDVDALTQKVRRATALIKFCKEKLRKTEKEIKDILRDFEKEEKTG